jgi:hypothetical protein
MKTIRQRQDERREEKLSEVRRQIADGSLVVRQMTAEERARHVARPRPARRKYR